MKNIKLKITESILSRVISALFFLAAFTTLSIQVQSFELLVGNSGDSSFGRYNGTTGAFIGSFVLPGDGGLGNPFGPTVGPDGNLYVTSQTTASILRYDGNSGAFIDIFIPLGAGGIGLAIDTIFGPDDDLYVLGHFGNHVIRYDGATGAFLNAFVPSGSGGLDSPQSMIFGPDGHLYINSTSTDEILRFDGNSGTFIDAFVSAGSGGLEGPNSHVFGPDGHLYVSNSASRSVLRYNGTTGAFIDVFVPPFSAGLDGVADLTFGPDGNLYVAAKFSDPGPPFTGEILRYNGSTGGFIDAFIQEGHGGLNSPNCLIFVSREVEVTIDIKPGSFRNSINPRSNGNIPVAILSTDNFNAETVNPLSVEFGPDSALEVHGKGHLKDVDDDGDVDLVLHFRTKQTGIHCGELTASLTGERFDLQRITGSDAIATRGCQ